mmetsp:Transcript_59492/g.141670  ORF Transcript_59492/g.141670 Transcript_59492/m.141670 type:complete len:193 (-) Transcript_59492:133-711(-)
MTSSAGAKVWNELKLLRHRDMLQRSLLRVFERDQHECRVIQSKAFRPILSRWTTAVLNEGKSCLEADPHSVPKEVQQEAEQSQNPQVRWLVKRLLSGDCMRRGPPHFPSTLMYRGPQYPFQPEELRFLTHHAGSLRGTELTNRIELPEAPAGADGEPVNGCPTDVPARDLWAEGCYDDDDFIDFRKAPFGAM